MHLLGTPYKGNERSAIQAYDKPATDIEAGLVYSQTTNVSIKVWEDGETPAGITGGTEHRGISGVVAGLEVFCQVADDVNDITLGEGVYVTTDGKITNSADGNTQVNAVWVADASGTILFEDGVVNTGANKRTNQKCAMISFVGGL